MALFVVVGGTLARKLDPHLIGLCQLCLLASVVYSVIKSNFEASQLKTETGTYLRGVFFVNCVRGDNHCLHQANIAVCGTVTEQEDNKTLVVA